MKKLTHILVALVMTFAAVISLSACGKNPVTSATVSGLDLSVAKGETLDTSKAIVTAKYEKGDKKTFSGDDLTFGTISTAEMGTQDLTITINPEDYTFTVSIRIVASEADVNAISQLESELVKEYNANRLATGEHESFTHKDITLRAGTENPFHFRLKAAGIAADGETLIENIANVRTNVKVELKDGANFRELTGTELESYVSVNTINAVLDFTDPAAGKTFRITVAAANPDEGYETNNYTFSTLVDVVKGLNVYDTVDLSAYDNYHLETNPYRHEKDWYREGWKTYHDELKARYGFDDAKLASIDTLILQDNIEITRNNVRDDAFWHATDANYAQYQQLTDQTLLDTPHNTDNQGLFQRMIAPGEEFKMIGNYFAIDIQQLPKMVIYDEKDYINFSGDQAMTSYFSLFKTDPAPGFQTLDLDPTNPEHKTSITYDTMSFIGNGGMSADVRNSGSVLLMKHDIVDFYGYNTTANNFYTTYYFAYGNPNNPNEGHYVVEDCNGFNSYTSSLYIYGGEDITLINSKFTGSSGPAVLAECLVYESRNAEPEYSGNRSETPVLAKFQYRGDLGPKIKLVNTILEAKASGHEPWYTEYDAGSAVGLMAMLGECLTGGGAFAAQSSYYTDTNSTVVADVKGHQDTPRLNLQVVIFGSGIITNTHPISGSVTIYNSKADYEAGITSNHALDLDNYVAENVAGAGAPVFECTATGAFRTAPIAETGLIKEGIVFPDSAPFNPLADKITTQYLNGLYAGLWDGLNKNSLIGNNKGQFPLPAPTTPISAETALEYISSVLSQAVSNRQNPDPAAAAYMASMFENLVDSLYTNDLAPMTMYSPVLNWDKYCEMDNADIVERVALKAEGIILALTRMIARSEDQWSGNHVNLYLPGSDDPEKTFGYMGVVMGLYPAANA